MPITTLPDDTEVEVSLIGSGGGYGESIILKIGFDKWVVIDSCINPNTSEPLPLEYLQNLKIDLNNVKIIICTHWHDDHIRGISKILESCPNADLCFSSANDQEKFLILCELDHMKAKKGGIASTKEFLRCIEILNDRKSYKVPVHCNSAIMVEKNSFCNFELFAISPSPKTIQDFELEISQLITDFGIRSFSIPNQTPNEKSVALLLKFGTHRVLLGADLEVGETENVGWKHVINHCIVIDNVKAGVFKIPHHGSENGYDKDIFNSLVVDQGVLKMTPWNKNKGLPTDEMMNTYRLHSDTVYITSKITSRVKPKKRDKDIQKIIDRFSLGISEIKYDKGIIRSRIDFTDINGTWKTELFDSAYKI